MWGLLAAVEASRAARPRAAPLRRGAQAFVLELSRSLKRRAKAILGLDTIDDALTGAVSVIQRGDSALRLNVHFHVLALDGVDVRDRQSGELVFQELAAPTADEVTDVATRTAHRRGLRPHRPLGRTARAGGSSRATAPRSTAPARVTRRSPSASSSRSPPSAARPPQATASPATARASRCCVSATRPAHASPSGSARAAASACTPRSPFRRATALSSSDSAVLESARGVHALALRRAARPPPPACTLRQDGCACDEVGGRSDPLGGRLARPGERVLLTAERFATGARAEPGDVRCGE